MTQASEVERIARGLTEAQRRAVSSATLVRRRSAWLPEGWYYRADRRVRYNLCLAGLASDYLTPSNRLTPLGLSVRNYLKEHHND